MRFFKGLLFGALFVILIHIWLFGWDEWRSVVEEKWSPNYEGESLLTRDIPPLKAEVPSTSPEAETKEVFAKDYNAHDLFIGMSEEQLIDRMGEPTRRDPSAYGYEWWIYNQNWEQYIQVGVYENKVNMFYTNAPEWSWANLAPGMSYSEWQENWNPESEIAFQYLLGYFTFSLTEQDLKERPLKLDGKTAIQIYVDVHDQNKISGIRVMDLETLLLHRPYALKYVGKLPEASDLSEQEWQEVEKSYESQIFDIVNVTRHRNQLDPFEWHEQVAFVAKGHSLDMLKHQFFDHNSPSKGELSDRLEKSQVKYRSAGENIAWNYVDGPDAHEGWMNSLGHRKNVMKADFSHLGVGVVQKYYTQNFITP
jgi:uncharacterized protein YkwD